MDSPLNKRFPSLADIAEMKASGYAPDTLERAREAHQRGLIAREVCSEIRAAFKGVILGNGVGLREGWGLDEYEDAAACAAHREKDEKDNWEHIPRSDLNLFRSSLSFFDAEGMRFHLPAFLIADLEDEEGIGMEFSLTHLSDHGKEQFSLLSSEQRSAVRRYLIHIRTDPDSEYYLEDIDNALENYWTDELTPESQGMD